MSMATTGGGGCGQDCPIVQMRKAEAQRGDVTVPGPEPSLSSDRCFPNSCQPPLGLGLIWEYGESYGPFAVKSGYRYLHENVVYNFREVKFSLKVLDKSPYQPSKCICLHTPSPSQAWALGEGGEGHWSPLPAPALKGRKIHNCVFSVRPCALRTGTHVP